MLIHAVVAGKLQRSRLPRPDVQSVELVVDGVAVATMDGDDNVRGGAAGGGGGDGEADGGNPGGADGGGGGGLVLK